MFYRFFTAWGDSLHFKTDHKMPRMPHLFHPHLNFKKSNPNCIKIQENFQNKFGQSFGIFLKNLAISIQNKFSDNL